MKGLCNGGDDDDDDRMLSVLLIFVKQLEVYIKRDERPRWMENWIAGYQEQPYTDCFPCD